MPPRPLVPPELKAGPFTAAEARRVGVGRHHLRGSTWRRIGPETYVLAAIADRPLVVIESVARRLPPNAAFSGLTAAWLHGLDVVPCDPVEVTLPHTGGIWLRAGLSVRRAALDPEEIVTLRGYRSTNVERTIADLAARLTLTEAVVITDMALYLGLTSPEALQRTAVARRGLPGVRQLRRVLELAQLGAESPMETRLRLLFLASGLHGFRVQEKLFDHEGRVIARADFYFPEAGLVVEYDGEGHREQLVEDNRRQNRLVNAGFRVLRFTAADVLRQPEAVVAQVRAALAATSR